jgi:hypothetical protein
VLGPVPDVLASHPAGSGPRPTRRRVRVLGGVGAAAAVAAAALLVPPWLAGPAPADAGAEQAPLTLRAGPVVIPRRDAPPVQGRVRGGVHVEVVNTGRRAVLVTSAALVPGTWQVDVVQDGDNAVHPERGGRFLRPGWSAVLVLHRLVDCTGAADHGPVPTRLVVRAELDDRRVSRTIDVGPAQRTYAGGLDDLLSAPEVFCAPAGGPGTVGDPGAAFLDLADPQ